MKKFFITVSAILLSVNLWAQAPQSFSYQAVVRGANNELLLNKKVGMKISLLQGSETGKAVYVEIHTPTSNENGLVSIAIGGGIKDPSSIAFTSIDWAKGPYFVQTETDPAGGTSYLLSSVSQLLSVPYALHSKTAESIIGGSILPNGGTNGQIITNCDGIPTWTTGGICPGKIAALNCAGVTVDGSLNNGIVAFNVSFVITYSEGNGGSYSSQSISSTGVLGLTTTLEAGTFVTGNGSLRFTVSGKPNSVGNALFSLTIAGQVCLVSIVVQETIGKPGPNITDAENNTYKTVSIGTQQWMAENLKVSKYSDGTTIPNIIDNAQWSKLTTGAWSYYNNDAANNAKYGKLYNWYAVSKTTNGNKNVCPTGWHVPTDAEWTVLIDYLGGSIVAGGKMKEVGTTNWNSPNTDATNTSLFSGLPGGGRANFGSDFYDGIRMFSWWWSSSESSINNAWFRSLFYNVGYTLSNSAYKSDGYFVRCLKD